MKTFQGRPVSPGTVQAAALVTHDIFRPLPALHKSLVSGDRTGKCTDSTQEELTHKPLAGKALCLPGLAGPAGDLALFSAAETGRAPSCLLFSGPIPPGAAAGVLLTELWGNASIVTVDSLGEDFLATVKNGDLITVQEDGSVTVS